MKSYKKCAAVAAAAAMLSLGVFTACAHTHDNKKWDYSTTRHWKVCSVDGKIDENSYSAHDFTGSSTCECGYLMGSEIDYGAHVHIYSDWGHNATGHWKECPEDKETDKSSYAAHSFTNGVCECGYVQSGSSDEGTDGEINNNPVAGAVKITKAEGDLEAAYVEWDKLVGATWYNVYCMAEGGSWQKLDAPLVREYESNFRADAVGLKAGKYTLKVVPVEGGAEKENFASTAKITVIAHERTGFAFVNGTSSGAYNDDGTLKSDARVIYVTEETKDSVKLEVTGAESNPCVGMQAILLGYSKAKETRPLAVRFVGNITDLAGIDSNSACKGDLVISNKTSKLKGGGVTFEGIGSDATINGWGIRVKNASNVEIRNLGFMNCNSNEGDNIGLQQDKDRKSVV